MSSDQENKWLIASNLMQTYNGGQQTESLNLIATIYDELIPAMA